MKKYGHFVPALFAWLLWYHLVEYRYPLPVQKDEKGSTKGFHKFLDSWSLEDAFESKKECLDALARVIKKTKRTHPVDGTRRSKEIVVEGYSENQRNLC